MRYTTIKETTVNEINISRSIFIATIVPIKNEDDAICELNNIRKKYSDATHNVYAYIANKDGTGVRFSDDGEPSGTAASPMLEVLKKKKIVGVLAVVTRYFGGIKLGAGGLVQAYVRAVTDALDSADFAEYSLCGVYNILVTYNLSKVMQKTLSGEDYAIISTEYNDAVCYTVAIKGEESECIAKINNLSLGSAVITKIKEEYILI